MSHIHIPIERPIVTGHDDPVLEAQPARAVVSLIFEPHVGSSFSWPLPFEIDQIDFTTLDSLQIEEIAPSPQTIADAVEYFQGRGFAIEGRTEVGLSISGTGKQFKDLLGFNPLERGRDFPRPVVVPMGEVTTILMAAAAELPKHIAAFEVAVPGVLVWASGSPTNPGPVDLDGLRTCFELDGDVREGEGVHVRLVDSGFAGDWPLDGVRPGVEAIDVLDPGEDECGHGTAVAAHVRAIAPKCKLSMRKFVDESGVRNYPVAAFQRAVESQAGIDPVSNDLRPDVILCSWALAGTSVALQLEIANAVRQGILVVFASGNSNMSDEKPHPNAGIASFMSTPMEGGQPSVAYRLCPVAHPEILSVGGVTKSENGSAQFSTNDYTPVGAHFFSKAFVYPGGRARTCPDIVGLTAPMPESPFELPGLIATPTSKGSTLDRKLDGDNIPNDASFKSSGTSMTAGQIAGIAALLIEAEEELKRSPAAVKNVLISTARSGEDPPWSPMTGHGVASPNDARTWLRPELTPRIRTKLNPWDSLSESPDIILLGSASGLEAKRRLGQSFMHAGGGEHIGDAAQLDDAGGKDVWVRVRNQGRTEGECRVTLAIVNDAGMAVVGEKLVDLAPGGFEVVGPFQLATRPVGQFLVAEAIPSSMNSELAGFASTGGTPLIDQVKELGFAARGVRP